MSPAGTRARVYDAIKARVLAGEFAPGERIDPARLAPDLAASVTPIRDALHRLAGERLVDSSAQDGFRQPLMGETQLRHLYSWSDDLVRLVLRAGERDRVRPSRFQDLMANYADAAAIVFGGLSRLSVNGEHRSALSNAIERLHPARLVEPDVVVDARVDLTAIQSALETGDWAQARRASAQYHAARQRRVPEITAALLARRGE